MPIWVWILSFCRAIPHLEEAYRVAELLFPKLPVGITLPPPSSQFSPVGEVIANERIPASAS